jgi:hypothetical protein
MLLQAGSQPAWFNLDMFSCNGIVRVLSATRHDICVQDLRAEMHNMSIHREVQVFFAFSLFLWVGPFLGL